MRTMVAVLVACVATVVQAQQLTCSEDPGTSRHMCYAEKQIKLVNGKREAPLYMGGPRGVDRTGFTMEIDCQNQFVKLRDRQGVAFAGGSTMESRAMRDLSRWICETKLK